MRMFMQVKRLASLHICMVDAFQQWRTCPGVWHASEEATLLVPETDAYASYACVVLPPVVLLNLTVVLDSH